MAIYTVIVEETLSVAVEVEAETEEEAVEEVEQRIRDSELILDADDFAHREVYVSE